MAEKQGKSSSKKGSSKSKKSKGNGVLNLIRDARTRTILGLFFVIVSVFLTLSFISYMIDGFSDQSQLQNLWEKVMDPDEQVNNWMGKIGADVAHRFIYTWFGISAFLFPFLLLLGGFKILFRQGLLPLGKSIKHALFFLYLVPLAMGYMVNGNSMLSGALGFHLNRWTTSLIGSAGTAMLLLFMTVVYLAVVFNLSVDGIRSLFAKNPKLQDETPEVDDDGFEAVADITVKTNDLDISEIKEEPEPVAKESPDAGALELEPTPVETPPKKTAEKLEDVAFEIETTEVKEEEIVSEKDGEDMGDYDPT
ncbi:MAG: DNA translocase FtsK 4TM domain-containing protein, partial [Flavobacteriales bacterium]|nr:DNA translocase FtsK 4TM domain-containing protein [Flavobacteriales bacterium]